MRNKNLCWNFQNEKWIRYNEYIHLVCVQWLSANTGEDKLNLFFFHSQSESFVFHVSEFRANESKRETRSHVSFFVTATAAAEEANEGGSGVASSFKNGMTMPPQVVPYAMP